MMMKKEVFKNISLVSMFVLSQIPFVFRGDKLRVDWYLLIEHTKRIDFAVLYGAYSINFLILAYCLHYPKGVSKFISRLILILSSLDLIHYFLLAKQGFGIAKVGIAMLIAIIYIIYKKKNADY